MVGGDVDVEQVVLWCELLWLFFEQGVVCFFELMVLYCYYGFVGFFVMWMLSQCWRVVYVQFE